MPIRVDVVFDVADGSAYYGPTLDALDHAAGASGIETEVRVVRTDTIGDAWFADLPDAVLIGPGTPYRNPPAAELVIMTARERNIPLVGT